MSDTLLGKRAIVFGASSGIGQAIAVALGKAGAEVFLTYRGNSAGAEKTKSMMPKHARCWIHKADMSYYSEIERCFDDAVSQMGGINIAVLVAAQFHMAPLAECGDALIEEIVKRNVTAPFIFSREAVKRFLSGGKGGKILYIGSSQGRRPLANTSLYACTKGILPNLAKSVCLEHGRDNIQAFVLSPGVTMAAGNIKALSDAEARKRVEEQIPAGRILDPKDLADLALSLLRDTSGCLTGTEILIDGGLLCAGPQV